MGDVLIKIMVIFATSGVILVGLYSVVIQKFVFKGGAAVTGSGAVALGGVMVVLGCFGLYQAIRKL